MQDTQAFKVQSKRDHGGGLDAAMLNYGGAREAWIDLSTGINPHPYEVPCDLPAMAWQALPDQGAVTSLKAAARQFWNISEGLDILPAPGASVLIAMMPTLRPAGSVQITVPTYNEHAAAFRA